MLSINAVIMIESFFFTMAPPMTVYKTEEYAQRM